MSKPTAKIPIVYGVLGEFDSPVVLLGAARAGVSAGYTRLEAYSPFPIEGMPSALQRPMSRLPLVFLFGGLSGGAIGYAMQWFAMAIDYPLNVGGRPLHSWPAFIPVTFELTILGSAVCGIVALFFVTRLPRLHHPLFYSKEFSRASQDRFLLCLEGCDPRFDCTEAERFLNEAGAVRVTVVNREGGEE